MLMLSFKYRSELGLSEICSMPKIAVKPWQFTAFFLLWDRFWALLPEAF